jgi:CHAT domain-containing protein
MQEAAKIKIIQGDFDQALDWLEQSIQLNEALDNPVGIADAYLTIGRIHFYREQLDKTASYFDQSLNIYQDLEDIHPSIKDALIAQVFIQMGQVAYVSGDLDRSLELYNQVLQAYEEISDFGTEAAILHNIAKVHADLGNWETALGKINQAIQYIESSRNNVLNEDLRMSLFASKQDYYQLKIEILMQLGNEEAAFETSEAARARTLVELLNEANVDIRQGVDLRLLAEEQELRQKLQAIEDQRVNLLGREHTQSQVDELTSESDHVLSELAKKVSQIRDISPAYADLRTPEPLSLQEIQQQVLDQDTVLLQYALGKEHSYLFVVTKTDLEVYPLAVEETINPIAEDFFVFLEERATNQTIAGIGGCLAQHILPPEVLSQMQGKQVLIAADGILHTIPFAALPLTSSNNSCQNQLSLLDAATNTQSETHTSEYVPLIKQFRLVNIPSATAIHTLRQQVSQQTTGPSKQLALLADPVFKDDPRLSGGDPKRCTVADGSSEIEEGSPIVDEDLPIELQVALRNTRSSINPLPCTRYEADEIIAHLPATDYALDFSATQDWINQTALDDYRMVHFATHGIADNQNPGFSGLLLSQFESPSQQLDDYFLSLSDVFNLRLAADLVVLSACDTGQGENMRGEGIIGLTRGFMYAGAERIVSSLWKVDDPATAELMESFYTAMLDDAGLSPAEALRQAQIAMLESGKAPYYWAAFTIQGEWRE